MAEFPLKDKAYLAVLILAFDKHVLEEVVVVLLHLLVGHVGQVGAVSGLGRVLGVDVEVGEEHRLGERGLVVDPGATVTMGTSSCKQKNKHKMCHLNVPSPSFTCFEEE